MKQEQVDFYELFKNKWSRKQAQIISGDNIKEYTVTAHMKRVNQ